MILKNACLPARQAKVDPFLIIMTPILLFLVFWNLGNQYLWYDEAQTAVLARSTLEYGYPRAMIGDFLVATDETYGPGMSYIAQPWLQNYVCALSFVLFGESNVSARVFFAIFGFLSFYLLYGLSRRLFEDINIARLTVVIATTCIPFFLHLRQCRYYSLTIFFTLAVLLSYLGILERRKWSFAFFTGASFMLFHANFGCFIPTAVALAAHFFFTQKEKSARIKFVKLYAWIFILVLPWAVLYKVWAQGAENALSLFHNAKFYLSKINGYFFPYRFLAVVLAIIIVIRRKIAFSLDGKSKRALIFLGIVIVINWVFLWFVDFNSARYIVHMAGLFFIIEAFLLVWVLNWNKTVGALLILALCFTNLLNTSLFYVIPRHFAPLMEKAADWAYENGVIKEKARKKIAKELGKLCEKAEVKTYFFDYIYEITHDYDGPTEGVVKYLKQFAKPGDTIKTHSFNANPLYFYTDLKIDTDFSRETYPGWIFLRDYWDEEGFFKTAYFKNIEKKYEKIELDYPDIWWENRPDDMSFHHFKTAPLNKKISLYRRK